MVGIAKRFGDVQALTGVDFTLRRHEVHVVAGENGAGKTTLMNVLAGLYQPDAGHIAIDDRPVRITSPRDALDLGIGMVHQHFELVAPFTVLENVVLGKEGGGWTLRRDRIRTEVGALVRRYGLSVDLDARIRDISIGVQQKVEILKALYRGVDVLILDEPTTHLTPQEVDALFAIVRQLVDGGLTVVLITHKLREIRGIGDRVTVMRRGAVVGTLERAEATEERLVELLMGARLRVSQAVVNVEDLGSEPTDGRGAGAAPPTSGASFRLESVSVLGPVGNLAVDTCSLEVPSGQIVGLAGVAGNGQRELAEAILGTRPLSAGRLLIGGRDLTRASVRDRLLAGLAYVPEDRMREGILPHLSLAETFILGPHHAVFDRGWLFDDARVRALARRAIEEYGVAASDESVPTARLSGGNIQKVLVARAMLLAGRAGTRVLVAMNPARGLDLRTTQFVHQQLLALRDRGGAVLLVSEDLDELMRLSDRIVVMDRGRLTGSFQRADFDVYRIGSLMTGGSDTAPAGRTSPETEEAMGGR